MYSKRSGFIWPHWSWIFFPFVTIQQCWVSQNPSQPGSARCDAEKWTTQFCNVQVSQRGLYSSSVHKKPKWYFIFFIMLFCETYQSTNLDSLKLLSFYFTIFLYSRQFLFRFHLKRLSFPVSKECKLQNLQIGSIWSLEMTFNYNHLYLRVMQWIKLEH